MKNLVNLTENNINIVTPEGVTITIPPSGVVAKAKIKYKSRSHFKGVPVVRREVISLEGIPSEKEILGNNFIVSSIVLEALEIEKHTYRGWFYAPDTGETCIRDKNGKIEAITRLIG